MLQGQQRSWALDGGAAAPLTQAHFRKSSQWTALTRRHAELLANDTTVFPALAADYPCDDARAGLMLAPPQPPPRQGGIQPQCGLTDVLILDGGRQRMTSRQTQFKRCQAKIRSHGRDLPSCVDCATCASSKLAAAWCPLVNDCKAEGSQRAALSRTDPQNLHPAGALPSSAPSMRCTRRPFWRTGASITRPTVPATRRLSSSCRTPSTRRHTCPPTSPQTCVSRSASRPTLQPHPVVLKHQNLVL